ncbi:hypothetical protein B9Z55_008429 [Caenorhabditis nigoni]|uniref:RING-type domain-containing protein n=1 Tax=Caenorhabditis nigoni TaxID=1611254 RepID=A0A2G5UNJ4_9PELO|nr:hypothetical protein B9Z55_008429 [Caenorhabditis nigoni]
MITPPFLTNYIQLANIAVTIIASVAAYILTPIFYESDYFKRLNVAFIATAIFIGFVGGSYNSLSEYVSKSKLIISFFTIFSCGLTAKIWIFYQHDADLLGLFYIFFVCNVTSAIIYVFVHKHIGEYQMKYRGSCGRTFFISLMFGINALILVLGITIGAEYEPKFGIIFFQCYYSFFTASLVDFVVGLGGGLQDYEPVHIELPRRNNHRTTAYPGCPICIQKFSETEIPRVLKCGHTICQQCARNLKGETNKIQCPTCRQETIVEGSIESLPKNFAVLDIQQEN